MNITDTTKVNLLDSELKVISIPIEEGFVCLRGLSPKRLRFEIEYGLERGTTSNTFLITDENNQSRAFLVHPPGAAFRDCFIEAISNVLPNNNIELVIIVGHVNPNRISLLQSLARNYPQMKLICSNPGAKLLKELWYQRKPSSQGNLQNTDLSIPSLPIIDSIKKKTTIRISATSNLQLIPAPTARWPGGLLAFEMNLGLLMSDKIFAAHICTQDWAEINSSKTEEDRRYYFDCLMSPMSSQIDSLLDKLEELDIRSIAPGHGPAIDGSWRSLWNNYRRWSEAQQTASINVVLLYASAYGNTAAIADALANGVGRTNVRVESLNCEFTEVKELVNSIKAADAYLIGSPTLGGHAPTPIVSALGTLLAEGNRENPVGIFGSYGWSGEALDLLENKLRDGGFKFAFDPIKVQFSPDTAMVKAIEETGTLFGRRLLNKKRPQQTRATGGISASRMDPTLIALGRIIGSLCVLTARKGDGSKILSGAMVASWVSQASFSPPGLTIAVAKDRAVESLLHCDDHFALNILADGRHNNLMKQFLQSFKPGEDRFSGLEIYESPEGQPILPEALAWLEGCVKQRMECGDHWLIYAKINHGKVLDLQGVTAVHHRRTGATY